MKVYEVSIPHFCDLVGEYDGTYSTKELADARAKELNESEYEGCDSWKVKEITVKETL